MIGWNIGLAWARMLYRLHRLQNKKAPEVRNVYVLRTHVLNPYVQGTFQKMQQQLGAGSVFLLFDATKNLPGVPAKSWNDPDGVVKGPAVITITEDDCQRINRLHLQGREAGSMHRVEAHVTACYKAIRQPYDYLWFIEYDVYCQDFATVVAACNGISADLLTAGNRKHRLLTVRNKPKWYWWPSLVGEIAQTPMQQRLGCFFPINRFSVRFLNVIEQNLSKSTGYCEVYFPTLAKVNGLSVKLMPRWLFATFRYKPNIEKEKIQRLQKADFRLYHPVKEL